MKQEYDGPELPPGHNKSRGCARRLRSAEDITGMRSGKLVALEPTDVKRRGTYLWRCQCDCGKELLVEAYKIRSQRVKSCGCSRRGKNTKDLTGKRFGKLVALRRLDEKIGSSYAWLCQCDCGCGRVEAVRQTMDAHGTVADHCHFVDGTCVEKISDRKKLQKNNTSGCTGVQVRGNRYIASISFKGKTYYLGSFSKFEDAVRARKRAEERMFGEFLEEYYASHPPG